MTIGRQSAACALFAAVLMLSARRADAQSASSWQVAAGYSVMHDANDHVNFPIGWSVAAARRLNGWLSIAADIDGHHQTIPSIGSDVHLSAHAVLVGVKVSARLGVFNEFGQLLVGPLRTAGTAFGSTDTNTRWAAQPGIGLDYPLKKGFALRVELDARFLKTGQELRTVAGLVYAFH